MSHIEPSAVPESKMSIAPASKPRDDELDFFGLTHQGLVRRDNQDHFLVCTLHKTVRVRTTSLPHAELLEMPSQRLASFGMVADGVGGSRGGEVASRAAVEAIAWYVTNAMHCFYTSDASDQPAFAQSLQEGAERSHAEVRRRADESGSHEGATTLTLFLAVWPTMYLLQIGDSRAYRLRDGRLEQLTRDQTMAQEMIDRGVLPKERAERSPLSGVLVSSLGGPETRPVVTHTEMRTGDVYVVCSDGLTRHVNDDRIRARLTGLESSESAARGLVDDAIAAGGTDNVTVLVLRDTKR